MTAPGSGLPEACAAFVRQLARELARELGALPGPERARQEPEGERYLSVRETCERFQISRATFDRMLRDPSSKLTEVIVRLPPTTGRVKVPQHAFETWLRERRQRRGRGRDK